MNKDLITGIYNGLIAAYRPVDGFLEFTEQNLLGALNLAFDKSASLDIAAVIAREFKSDTGGGYCIHHTSFEDFKQALIKAARRYTIKAG